MTQETARDRKVNEMVRVLSTENEGQIRAYMREQGIRTADAVDPIFWASVYKAMTGNTRFSMYLRTKAKRWLLAHNLMPMDDGDVPV